MWRLCHAPNENARLSGLSPHRIFLYPYKGLVERGSPLDIWLLAALADRLTAIPCTSICF